MEKHKCSGQPAPMLGWPRGEQDFLPIPPEHLLLHLHPLLLIFSPCIAVKSLAPSPPYLLVGMGRLLSRAPKPSLLQAEQTPSLGPWSQDQCSSPDHLSDLHRTHSSLSYTGVPKLDTVCGGHLDVVPRLAMQMEQVDDRSQRPLYQVQVAIRRAKGERGPRDSGPQGCPAAFPHHI